MLLLNATEKDDSKCYCLLDTGANALVLPTRDSMRGSEAQCTVLGGGVVSGMVVQVVPVTAKNTMQWRLREQLLFYLCCGSFYWLDGNISRKWTIKGKMCVSVQSPEGVETELTERSKMHYLDQDTFWAV